MLILRIMTFTIPVCLIIIGVLSTFGLFGSLYGLERLMSFGTGVCFVLVGINFCVVSLIYEIEKRTR